jgi:DNA-3-methyladenine glycosylase
MKNSFEIYSKLPSEFYTRELLDVAIDLIGKTFVRHINKKTLAGVIVEVEAYDGRTDKAAHSFGGPTERNKIMFEKGGLLYVYFIYGMHYCCNVVTGQKGIGNAVLIRALQPVMGIEKMIKNRFGNIEPGEKHLRNLTNGPAKITQALNINKVNNGTDLGGNEIYLSENNFPKDFEIVSDKRIGIKKSTDLPWRFYIKNNPYVSHI